MKKDKLIEYCEKHEIMVPKGATVEHLNAVIVRHSLNKKDVKLEDGNTCFGFWEHENTDCVTCDFEGKCFRAAHGTSKEDYFKKLERLENPRIRFK